MSSLVATVSYGSTGLKTLNLGFQPNNIEILVGSSFGSSENYHHKSHGVIDENGNQMCTSSYQDASDGKTINNSGKCVYHMDSAAGVLLEAAFDSFTATGFKLNVTVANANYQLIIIART